MIDSTADFWIAEAEHVNALVRKYSAPDDSCVTVKVPFRHSDVQAYLRALRSGYMEQKRKDARLDASSARRRRIALHG